MVTVNETKIGMMPKADRSPKQTYFTLSYHCYICITEDNVRMMGISTGHDHPTTPPHHESETGTIADL
jgi:hypothetical protein